MSNTTRWGRPSIFNLRRDIDDALDEFTSPRALRREIDRLFGEDLSPRSLLQEMDRVFDEFVSPMPLRRRISSLLEPLGVGGGGNQLILGGRGRSIFVPDVELVEHDNEYLLKVDVPGIRPEDVQISIDDSNILTIRGERREEQRRQRGGYEYTERSYGTFARSVELPRNVDPQHIDAEYRDGVLQLHIPKTEQQNVARQIPVRMREGAQMGQGQRGNVQGQIGGQSQSQSQSGLSNADQPRVVNPGVNGRVQSNPR